MVKEIYCSYEVAKLLKEKGFNEPCTELNLLLIKEGKKPVMRITHQKANSWLREKGILLWVYPTITLPVNDNSTFHWMWDGKKQRHDAQHFGDKISYNTYEDATEAALKYTLENLI